MINSIQSNQNNNDELDFIKLFNLFLRNKKFITFFVLLSTLLVNLFSLQFKKVWEGQFQIVLDMEESGLSSLGDITTAVPQFVGLNPKGKDNLKTQVGILESPSVLMPIFNFVNSEKKKNNINFKEINFLKWKKDKLEIELKNNTSILNIAYRDDDKNIIIPVLDRISLIYQDYSGKSKRREISLTKNYLLDQISIYKKKSSNSLREAQEFALEQDLIYFDKPKMSVSSSNKIQNNNLISTENSLSTTMISNIGIENIRVQAANEIRRIGIQIDQIKELENDIKQIQYIGSTIPGLVEEGLPKILEDFETKIIELRSKYTDKDLQIKRLEEKRDLFINLLKERAIGYLKAKKIVEQAKMEASMRPKGVLLKYKELIREAARDEKTLISLENQLNKINLEEARAQDPWELITKPTLLKFPVGISKFKLGFITSFLSLIIGTLIIYLREKKSGLLYNLKDLEEILNTNILESNFSERLTNIYFQNLIKNSSNANLCLFTFNLLSKSDLNKLLNSIKEINPNINIIIDKKIIDINKNDINLFVTSNSYIERSNFIQVRNTIDFYGCKFVGIIIINKKI